MSLIEDLSAARQHLWKFQERFNYFPDLNVEINGFRFNFKDTEVWWRAPLLPPYLKIEMKPETLRAVLDREDHYNNVEIGCRLRMQRRPNTYAPDAHMILSFFHLPGARR